MQTILRSSRYPMVISTGAASSVGRVGGHLHTPGGGRQIGAKYTRPRPRAGRPTRNTARTRPRPTAHTAHGRPRPRGRGREARGGTTFYIKPKTAPSYTPHGDGMHIACSDKRRRSYARHYARPGIHAHGLAARGWRTVTRQSTNGQPMSRCTLLSMHHLTKRCVGDHVPQRRRAFEQRRASTSATQVARLGSAQ